MKKIKYIICDLDGTLLNDERTISKTQADYLKDLCGRKDIRFGFASGRTIPSLTDIAREAGILDVCDVMVGNNGSDVYDARKKQTTETPRLSVEEIRTILELFQPYEWVNPIFHNPKGLFTFYETPRTQYIVKNNHYDRCHSPFLESFEPTPRVTLLVDPERMGDVRNLVEELGLPPYIQGVQSDKDVYDMIRRGVSKESGILTYVSSYGGTMEEVMVFGDGENDLAMMQAAGISVSMKNGTEEVKEKASYVTEKTNNEDGIMHFLKTVEDWFDERNSS